MVFGEGNVKVCVIDLLNDVSTHDEAILDICRSEKGITAEFVTSEQVAHNQGFYVTTSITIAVYMLVYKQ